MLTFFVGAFYGRYLKKRAQRSVRKSNF